jgi:signal transduction histidine kinase/CheY-like chemotaxis protein
MKRSFQASPAPRGERKRNVPQAEGERLVAWYRLAVAGLLLTFIAIYWFLVGVDLRPALLACAGLAVAWSASSAAVLAIDRRGLFRAWQSYLTIALDLAVVTAMQWAVTSIRPLHFMNGPVTGLYFVMIGLAALRGSRRLVILAGLIAAAVHLLFSAVCFHRFMPGLNVIAMPAGHAIGLNFLDDVGKALAMVTVGVVIGFVTDSLRTSERRYRHLFDHIPDGALIIDEQGRIRIANQRLADMIGVRRDALAGRPIAAVLKQTSPDHKEPSLLARSDGVEVPVRIASQPIEYQGDPCLEVSIQDVTEQVRLERQLSRSQRMDNAGQLAGGLTHDFNNLLGGIIGAASLSARAIARIVDTVQREKLGASVDRIRERGEAARDVVRRLLAFSRRSPLESTRVDLVQVVRDSVEICRNTFRKEIDIIVELPAGEAAVDGDAGALAQALLNLCINAQDAMPGGGRLSVRLAELASAAADERAGAPDQGCWQIEVADTGIGMDAATRERIFDPFFSTKPHALGTGLGLSMVDSIAREHGGFVNVESSPGGGAVFRLVLSRSRLSLLPDASGKDLPRGSGKILFADDDDLVRSTVTAMLTELGYEVVAAASGEEALRLFDSRAGGFDLLILDLMMPGLDGIQTLERIRARGGGVRTLIATGFWTADRSAEIEDLGVAGILHKPFSLSTLARELARIVADSGGGR